MLVEYCMYGLDFKAAGEIMLCKGCTFVGVRLLGCYDVLCAKLRRIS